MSNLEHGKVLNALRKKKPEHMEDFVGLYVTKIEGGLKDDNELTLHCDPYSSIRFFHSQDCCESVAIEDVCGDWNDILGEQLTECREATNVEAPDRKVDSYESITWTFYIFSSVKGSVTVRWLGESNGYYSESVDCEIRNNLK